MTEICTILPLKAFDLAKSRLSTVLSPGERATLARLLAVDVLRTITSVREAGRITILGDGAAHAALAAEFGCRFVEDDPTLDVSANVTHAARASASPGTAAVFYLPSDLPLLKPEDIRTLFALHEGGITICRAARDGGTNALVASPPAAAWFDFGSGSCKRHAAQARAAGRPVRVVDLAGFARDVDVPADLDWLCQHGASGRTGEWARRSGFSARFEKNMVETCPTS